MDTVTHALMGAQAALAVPAGGHLGTRERLLLGAAAGAFPDADFLGFLIDPLRFLADWHQGPTHSLLLLPAWGALLAGLFCLPARRRQAWAEALAVSCLGLASHIVLDLITVYGTRVLYPWSERRFSLGTTFLIDPILSGIIVASLGMAWYLAPARRGWALAGVALLCAYVGLQGVLKQRALQLGAESLHANGIQALSLNALPQPFSPFNWKLIAIRQDDYRIAHVNLAGHPPLLPRWELLGLLPAIAQAYVPPERIDWVRRARWPDAPQDQALARQLWARPDFAGFRRFAVYPSLSGSNASAALAISSMPGEPTACLWFTDLRYDLPASEDTFRYGFCRDGAQAPWRLYRLAYFSRDERRLLE